VNSHFRRRQQALFASQQLSVLALSGDVNIRRLTCAAPNARLPEGERAVYATVKIRTNVIPSASGANLMEVPMATFVVLASFSDQGIKNVKQTIERADAFKQMATKAGATVKDIYWTLGAHDIVAICEAPDDETATALSLSVASRGNVRSETLRAFSFDEMKKVLGKMV
jgi:uncharacterized protein with GYD domain